MKKSVTKRIRVTKNGKLIRRKMAQGHFRAGKNSRSIQGKRTSLQISKPDSRRINHYLNKKK
ncbi:MAG: hypothetical protein AAB659_01295 [Patescibacteria group bacterium]